ncbi:hypothetical protein IV454_17840 [Massilia antarctica]|uniref:Uncharacterized protein n=1 Tax=Massilia antarctica TaxID=2765360 RepID=A0AA48W959_9BURK|nr:hypothetical protein [Massilia antarctica]QPI47473.1 hypothetical protein IV454_17840 [Massilia antarctica]
MTNLIKCALCGGATSMVSEAGAIHLYKCHSCGNEFPVRVHFVDKPIPLGIKVFKAVVTATDSKAARKAQIQVRKVFGGMANFYPADLDRQILQGESVWDLGFYSADEVAKLEQSAANIGLEVQFVPS